MPSSASVFAHTTKSADTANWQELEAHLRAVAALATEHASAFGAASWGELAGLWHDLGKYHPKFQAYLKGEVSGHPHSGAGAVHAMERDKRLRYLLSFVIAGHHAGLANDVASEQDQPKPLRERLDEARRVEYPLSVANAPASIREHEVPELPAFLTPQRGLTPDQSKRQLEFWVRFLFSALVDADRLDTERFCDPEKFAKRRAAYATLPLLRDALESHLADKIASLDEAARSSTVNRARRAIANACLQRAAEAPGFFSLTVPTGGGKTLSAMRFALHHATNHGQRRVIVVIPYTSIIEQNAQAYADVFHPDNVVEHHSNIDPVKAVEAKGKWTSMRHELAAENWDAPIIVTTTVQFFESLFSNETSRCRKLHNIARSVVVLDEVQTLPPAFLLTICDGLNELVARYGCTVVLSTATPPALRERAGRSWGLANVREIVDNPAGLAQQLRRVTYSWPDVEASPVEWPALAGELAKLPQVLAVTHRRQDARELAQVIEAALGEKGTVRHLSALMCPAHRREVLAAVRDDLHKKRSCRLVSTQLIEAGVDVDFPVVYRALGGLDSVVQAAGRCNREGRLERGRVVVFRAPSKPPKGVPTKGLAAAETLLRQDIALQADDPATQERYFRELYFAAVGDPNGIQTERAALNFATVGKRFKLIEDGFTHSLVVPWKEEGARRVATLRAVLAAGNAPDRAMFRALQTYTINIYEDAYARLVKGGAIEAICDGVEALRDTHLNLYNDTYGLTAGDDAALGDPTKFTI